MDTDIESFDLVHRMSQSHTDREREKEMDRGMIGRVREKWKKTDRVRE